MISSRVAPALILLALALLACTLSSAPVEKLSPVVLPPVESSIRRIHRANITPPAPEFTVTGFTVYLRDLNDTALQIVSRGDTIQCTPELSGWCKLSDNSRIWSGCLEPNPEGRGCRERK